ncbi:MAG: M4 family metallopeptidase [Acidobacteria bacterium]|nr:M4 family metallopeptidase [Acidobacteriota bacterium]
MTTQPEAQTAQTRESGAVSVAAGHAADLDALREWDATVDGMARTGELVAVSSLDDASIEGRTHEYLAQYFAGIPVFGSGVSRQLDGSGVTVSLFGTLHPNIDVDTAPALSGAEVAALLEELHGGEILAGGAPSLGILPLADGSYALAYLVVMSDGYFYFADADDGRIRHRLNAVKEQSAVGAGESSRGNRQKLSTTQAEGHFQAHDRMRPAELVTLDLRFNFLRYTRLLIDHLIDDLPTGEAIWTANDYATDADNDWDDPTVVDTHSYTGWTYDYFSARHGWEGIDGENGRTISMVNMAVANAFFAPPPFGPEGTGVFGYGRFTDETSEEPLTTLDVVGHELMHGVTHFSVSNRTGFEFGLVTDFPASARLGPESFTTRAGTTYSCETARFPGLVLTPDGLDVGLVPAWCVDGRFLLASSQGGAIHEGYSDIFGESLGFFYENEGVSADYIQGGDFKEDRAARSMVDPKSLRNGFYPDVYRDRYEFALTLDETFGPDYSGFVFVDGRYFGSLGPNGEGFGYGGSHWNSLILSHAFYLAIEGGTHRTSGMTVEGIGGDNRAEIEAIFFRAMRDLMPAASSLPIAAAVLRQSAADLDAGGAAHRAVDQALRAVGL